jgi:hypothetical protein
LNFANVVVRVIRLRSAAAGKKNTGP